MASAATKCGPDDLWLVDDADGWAAVGCGNYASGPDPKQIAVQGVPSCDQLADFELRFCRMTSQREKPAALGQWAGPGPTSPATPAVGNPDDPGRCEALASRRYNECTAAQR